MNAADSNKLYSPSTIDKLFESESESWSGEAPQSWIYSLDNQSADPYYRDHEARSWKCQRPKVSMGLNDVKDKFGNWIDEKYRKGKPDDYFKDLFEMAADYGF